MADEKREQAILRSMELYVADLNAVGAIQRAIGRAYDTALADNAERVRELEETIGLRKWECGLNEAESALAEARATIERLEAELRKHRPFVMGTPI